MQSLVSRLLLYTTPSGHSLLENLAWLNRAAMQGSTDENDTDNTRRNTLRLVHEILDLATAYGFERNLWQAYLTYYLVTNENSFSLTCERVGATEGGSINDLARADLAVFHKLFHYDFTAWEEKLGTCVFSVLTKYQAIPKRQVLYNREVSEKINVLSLALSEAADADEMFDLLTAHYRDCGVGMFGMNPAFRVGENRDGKVELIPVNNAERVTLSDLVGYESQKAALDRNTRAFVAGQRGNNVLLYGDSGTGKSTSVKAVLGEYFDRGLRMIEIYKHQFNQLGAVIAKVKKRNYRFIIYIDDLSFEEHEIEYKYLKAVIEGGVETRPDNVLIYATSNRRHLIRETWSDRSDMEHDGDIHHSDTMEEKLSLAERFGLAIRYSNPAHEEYLTIVRTLAHREGLTMDDAALCAAANRFEIRHGGVSGRVARQLIDDLKTESGE